MLLIPQWYHNYDKLIKLAHGYQACNHTYPTPIIISKMGRVMWGYILGMPLAPVWWEPGMNKYCMKYIFFNTTSMISWFISHINRLFVNKGLQQISVEINWAKLCGWNTLQTDAFSAFHLSCKFPSKMYVWWSTLTNIHGILSKYILMWRVLAY